MRLMNDTYAHVWDKKRINNLMRSLIHRSLSYDAGEILYICKLEIDSNDPNREKEVFLALRRMNLNSPLMQWPYLALTTKSSIGAILMVTPAKIWDFKTGKLYR